MGQLLRLAIVLFGLWLVLRIIRRALARRRSDLPTPPKPASADMLRCDYCGVFVPRNEAVAARGRHYCSGGHADADRAGSQ
jgi:uncharacterized protein